MSDGTRWSRDCGSYLVRASEGRETEWERVLSDLVVLRGILGDCRGDAGILHELLAAEHVGDRRLALESASQPFEDALIRYRRAVGAISHEPLMASNLDDC